LAVVTRKGALQIPPRQAGTGRLPPDFLSSLVASVKPRAAFLKESRIRGRWLVQRVGNPEYAPNDTGASGARFSGAPTALRSSSGLIPSPSGLGSRLAAGPLGLASMAILQCHFSLNLPQASRLLGMTKWRALLASEVAIGMVKTAGHGIQQMRPIRSGLAMTQICLLSP
jgi:hypothetical protein